MEYRTSLVHLSFFTKQKKYQNQNLTDTTFSLQTKDLKTYQNFYKKVRRSQKLEV